MDGFTLKLIDFMKKTVCYGISGDVNALLDYAENTGLQKTAQLLSAYGCAVSKGDCLSAAKYFAALHMFVFAAES